jgi:predicted thioredoxin/glutaredoxin
VLAMEGILDSYATALWLYLTENIESPLSQRPFIEAVSRHVFYEGRSGESYERLARAVRSLHEEERSLYRERLREIVARNIMREIIWLGRDPDTTRERLDREYIEHILLARASIGRIGLIMGYPLKPHMERVEELYRFLRESWGEIYEKVLRETRRSLVIESMLRITYLTCLEGIYDKKRCYEIDVFPLALARTMLPSLLVIYISETLLHPQLHICI